jgi:multidrug efflux pump subunit AcrA (membrane-fusion protein)
MVLEMLKPEDINILPGMTATVTISFEHPVSASDRIVIPAIAVTHDSEKKPFVWVLDETDMTVKKNMVQVGELTDSNGIVIRDGLHGGEKIVTAGVTKLRPGMQVSVWDASN